MERRKKDLFQVVMEVLGFNLITPCSTNSKDKVEKEVKNGGQETTDEDAKERHPWNRLGKYVLINKY